MVDVGEYLAGYGEFDFLGGAQTANSNESILQSAYPPPLRSTRMISTHLLGGQTWSLLTMNTKGIIPRKEDIPLPIDAQYVPGFAWARQPQSRVIKDFNKTLWFGVSVENPQTTFVRTLVSAAAGAKGR